MTQALALRPKGKHPLHMLREFEIWPVEDLAGAPLHSGGRSLAALRDGDRAEVPWSSVSLRSDRALQEIFHTEERITPADVPRLCCGLPGVEACVLVRRREVLAGWNMPLDLKPEHLLDAASGALDRAIDAPGSGWGELQGLTLHFGVGSASLLRQGVLQLLVLHERRGFAPGVREKLTLALGVVARTLRAAP
ncbi:MAG: hypothetical protein IAE97_12160 [Chthoniobacterales bacterium]|nr:hypothetical protein [Chthoniobacterales bacterium]